LADYSEEVLDAVLIKADAKIKDWEIMNESDLSFFLELMLHNGGFRVYFNADFGTHFPLMREKVDVCKSQTGKLCRNVYPDSYAQQ
jgi:hypothetical protein